MESYILFMIGFYDCNIIKLINLVHGDNITKSGIASILNTKIDCNAIQLEAITNLLISKAYLFITASLLRANKAEETCLFGIKRPKFEHLPAT